MSDVNQRAFTKMVLHLRAQGVRSATNPGILGAGCKYRGSDGAQCAVGCLIADEHYSYDMEGAGASHRMVTAALERSGWIALDKTLLRDCQGVHDTSMPDSWEVQLAAVAIDHSLEMPPLA